MQPPQNLSSFLPVPLLKSIAREIIGYTITQNRLPMYEVLNMGSGVPLVIKEKVGLMIGMSGATWLYIHVGIIGMSH